MTTLYVDNIAPNLNSTISAPNLAYNLARTDLPTGSIIQVQQGIFNGTNGSASTAFTDIQLSVNITPQYSTSKIIVIADVQLGGQSGQRFGARIVRVNPDNSESVPQEAASAGSRTRVHASGVGSSGNQIDSSLTMQIFDSPATTQQISYKVQALSEGSTPYYTNRSFSDSDSSTVFRTSSHITVMEVVQ